MPKNNVWFINRSSKSLNLSTIVSLVFPYGYLINVEGSGGARFFPGVGGWGGCDNRSMVSNFIDNDNRNENVTKGSKLYWNEFLKEKVHFCLWPTNDFNRCLLHVYI